MTVKELRAKLFEIENQGQEVTAELLNKLNDGEYGNDTNIFLQLERESACDLVFACETAKTSWGAFKFFELGDLIHDQIIASDTSHNWHD